MSYLYYKWSINCRLEKLLIWFVWKLPRKLVMWCAVRLMSENHTESPDLLNCSDALKLWDKRTKELECN